MNSSKPLGLRQVLTLRGVRPESVAPPASAEISDTEFWFVWSPSRRAPRKRHATAAAALEEATRLAALHPGLRFHVYKAYCVGRVLK